MNADRKQYPDLFRGRPMSRREALHLGLGGAAAFLLAGRGGVRAYGAPVAAKARSVVQIWLWGGPCHIDTFDPKPGAGYDYCGPMDKAIPTNVDGILINELLPQLAGMANKYSLIRGMTHGINSHETAAYAVQTGHKAGDGVVYPSVGSVVSLFKGYDAGYKGLISPYVVLTELQGRFSECGFLGSRYKPFATGGNPAKTPFAVEGVVAEGITEERQRRRRDLMRNLDGLGRLHTGNERIAALAQCEDEAYELILGDAGKVFDLATEKEEVRARYGLTTFGQSCLMARRLVEIGVPYVTINYKGWDTHKQHFQTMRQKLPELDRGLSTLLADLSERGLLDSTVVWCGGEFGRTPKVSWDPPWNGGRNHFGAVFSTLVAGGGFRGGQVVGASDDKGMEVADRAVRPQDLVGSIYELLGIDPDGMLQHPQGRKVPLLPASSGDEKGKGRLREIMA
jgi:hypothetical protein